MPGDFLFLSARRCIHDHARDLIDFVLQLRYNMEKKYLYGGKP